MRVSDINEGGRRGLYCLVVDRTQLGTDRTQVGLLVVGLLRSEIQLFKTQDGCGLLV